MRRVGAFLRDVLFGLGFAVRVIWRGTNHAAVVGFAYFFAAAALALVALLEVEGLRARFPFMPETPPAVLQAAVFATATVAFFVFLLFIARQFLSLSPIAGLTSSALPDQIDAYLERVHGSLRRELALLRAERDPDAALVPPHTEDAGETADGDAVAETAADDSPFVDGVIIFPAPESGETLEDWLLLDEEADDDDGAPDPYRDLIRRSARLQVQYRRALRGFVETIAPSRNANVFIAALMTVLLGVVIVYYHTIAYGAAFEAASGATTEANLLRYSALVVFDQLSKGVLIDVLEFSETDVFDYSLAYENWLVVATLFTVRMAPAAVSIKLINNFLNGRALANLLLSLTSREEIFEDRRRVRV
ncbi:MAG: hypothetical protein ACFB00_01565 [Parvularculaceae bacterium]